MFQSFLEQQGLFVFFVTVYVGAGLIANDRRANALQIYLVEAAACGSSTSAASWRSCSCSCSSVTLLPGLLLVLLQVMFSGSFEFLRQQLVRRCRRSMLASPSCACSSRAFTMLALSSLSKSSRYVAVLYTGAIFFTDASSASLQRHHRIDARGLGLDHGATSTRSPT